MKMIKKLNFFHISKNSVVKELKLETPDALRGVLLRSDARNAHDIFYLGSRQKKVPEVRETPVSLCQKQLVLNVHSPSVDKRPTRRLPASYNDFYYVMSTRINVKAKVNFYDYIENLSAILPSPLNVYTPLEDSASIVGPPVILFLLRARRYR